MSEGEKIVGVGPKMLVSLVVSVLLVAIVVGKWDQISGFSQGDFHVDLGGRIAGANQSAGPNVERDTTPVAAPRARPAQERLPAVSVEPYQQYIEQLVALQLAGTLNNASADEAGLQMLAGAYRSPEQWKALLAMMDPSERDVFVRVIEPILRARTGGF